MTSRLLDRLKRSLFKEGQGAGPEQEAGCGAGACCKDRWEAELEDEEECVTERLGGTLSFDSRGEVEDGAEGEGLDSDSDFLGESLEEGPSSTDASPVGTSPSSLLTRQLQDSRRSPHGPGGGSPAHKMQRQADTLSFEVTDASVVQDGSSKYVLYTIHVIQSGGSDKTPAVITRRYSDFRRLHATLRRHHGGQMESVVFPRKKLRRNFTAETIAKRSRAFEQYLSHLCSLSGLERTACVRQFFYLSDLQTAQLLIRVGRYQDALGPLLNAKRLQDKLGGAVHRHSSPPPASTHWLFTLAGLSCCFQEVDQLEEARDHVAGALLVLTPPEGRPLPPQTHLDRPHPLLPPLLRAAVRLCWQTGKDKRRWEDLLRVLEEQGRGLEGQPTIKEFLVKCNLQESPEQG